MPSMLPEFQRIGREVVYDFVKANLIVDPQRFFAEGFDKRMAAGYADSTIRSARAATQAACVVFVHSVLDDFALELCKVAVMLAPEEWEDYVKQKKVTLHEVRQAKFEDLRRKKLDELLEDLGRESLLTKLDRLHACCKPCSGFNPVTGYKYSRDRLEDFDTLRHEIVHGDQLGQELANASDMLMDAHKTCFYLVALMNGRFGLKLNPCFPQWMAETERMAQTIRVAP